MILIEALPFIVIVGVFTAVIERLIRKKFEEVNQKLNFLIELSGRPYPSTNQIPEKYKQNLIRNSAKKTKRALKQKFGCSQKQVDDAIERILVEHEEKSRGIFSTNS